MMIIRFTLLILLFTSLNIYAQNQTQIEEQSNKTQAYKFDEYKKISTKKLKIRLSNFISRMLETRATGNMVIYAPNKKESNLRVEAIARFLRLTFRGAFFDFDVSRLTFIDIVSKEKKTEFWIIPKGAQPPIFKKQNDKL